MRAGRLCVWMLALALFAPAAAQEADEFLTNHNLRGVASFGSFQAGGVDAVNLGTGSVEVTIPLFTRRGRGLDYSRTLTYSSRIWTAESIEASSPFLRQQRTLVKSNREGFALRGVTGDLTWREDVHPCPSGVSGPLAGDPAELLVRSHFTYETAAGSTVRFPNRVVRNLTPDRVCEDVPFLVRERGLSDTQTMTLITPSAQGADYEVLFKDGSRETRFNESRGPARLTDADGNFLSGAVDTLGRSYSGLSYHDSQGSLRSFVRRFAVLTPSPSFPTAECRSLSGTVRYPIGVLTRALTVLESLELPNGLFYRFSYDAGFGELTRIDLPSGGYVRYEWTTLAEFDEPGAGLICRLDSRRVSKRIVSADGTAASEKAWSYSYARVQAAGGARYETEVVDPEGNRSVHVFDGGGIRELEKREYTGASTLERTTVHAWRTDSGAVASAQSLDGGGEFIDDGRNRRIVETVETWAATGETRSRRIEYDSYVPADSNLYAVDTRMNVIREFLHDYGQGVPGPLLKRVSTVYLHEVKPEYVQRHILDRPFNVNVFDGQGALAARSLLRYDERALEPALGATGHDDAGYPASFRLRGLLSKEQTILLGTGQALTALHWHDMLGNRVRTRSPRGFESFFSYQDDFDGTLCNAGQTRAFLTRATNALGQVERFSHYSCSSLTASRTDANHLRSEFRYDGLDRLRSAHWPDGGEDFRFYSDTDLAAQLDGSPVFRDPASALPLRARAFRRIEGTRKAERIRVLDGLGRISMQGLANRGEFDWTRFEYDGAGRLSRTSNPVTLASGLENPSPALFGPFTEVRYDGLGREAQTILTDGARTSIVHQGSLTTPSDPAGRKRRLRRDGLDRLIAVREPDPRTGSLESGFAETFYAYDALDNLLRVEQGGQLRSFEYDSASRLKAETHPESGRSEYAYDADGNRIGKTDARGIVSSSQYDALGRLLRTDYSDATPSLRFDYDTGALGAGLLATAFDGAGETEFDYDEMGRVSLMRRANRAPGGFEVLIQTDYVYDLAGNLRRVHYGGTEPSPGWLIDYEVDEQGRRTSITGRNLFDFLPILLVSHHAFRYQGGGALETTAFATNGTTETVEYGVRLQPQRRTVRRDAFPFDRLMDLSYSFEDPNTGINDGNVHRVDDLLDASGTMRYSYDFLNRLTGVGSVFGGWSIGYGYDRFGNRTAQAAAGFPPGFSPFAAAFSGNRIGGKSYDAAGNALSEGGRTLSWDAESRLSAVDGGAAGRYLYDWQGRRAVKLTPGDERFFFHEATGEVMWEWRIGAPQQDLLRIFHNGRAIFENGSPGGAILHADHLGSPRVKADVFSPVIRCRDLYSPFGQKHTAPCDVHRVGFTGKERDGETGFDYFGARYYAPVPGRFLSPDPLLDSADPADPQSWNRYGYSGNNPLRLIDPDGRIPIDIANPSAGAPEPEEPIPPGQALGAVALVVTTLTPIPGDEVGVAAIVGGKVASKFGGRLVAAGKRLLNRITRKTGDAGTSNAAVRAQQIHRVLDPRARQMRTTAVTETAEGTRVVSSSNRRLTPAQRSSLSANEIEGVGRGHAEVTGVNAARAQGLTPTGTAASRPICPNCAEELKQQGVRLLSPRRPPN